MKEALTRRGPMSWKPAADGERRGANRGLRRKDGACINTPPLAVERMKFCRDARSEAARGRPRDVAARRRLPPRFQWELLKQLSGNGDGGSAAGNRPSPAVKNLDWAVRSAGGQRVLGTIPAMSSSQRLATPRLDHHETTR